MQSQFMGFEILLADALKRKTTELSQRVDSLKKRLRHPGHKLQEQAQHLDHLDIRLRRALNSQLQTQRQQMDALHSKLARVHPGKTIDSYHQLLDRYIKQMSRSVKQQLQTKQSQTAQAMHLLDTVSPLKTLGRGYSIIRDSQGGVIKTIAGVTPGDSLKSQVADGAIYFTVDKTSNEELQ
jgi:exodeoxyribonuclease VII large subunit